MRTNYVSCRCCPTSRHPRNAAQKQLEYIYLVVVVPKNEIYFVQTSQLQMRRSPAREHHSNHLDEICEMLWQYTLWVLFHAEISPTQSLCCSHFIGYTQKSMRQRSYAGVSLSDSSLVLSCSLRASIQWMNQGHLDTNM